MKKLLTILILLFSVCACAQIVPPPGFTPVNQKYNWLAGKFDSTLGVPLRDTFIAPLFVGEVRLKITASDSIYYGAIRTTAGGRKWKPVGREYTNGYGLLLSGSTFLADTFSLSTRGRLYKVADSLAGVLGGSGANIYTISGTLTGHRTVTQAGFQMNFSGGTFRATSILSSGAQSNIYSGPDQAHIHITEGTSSASFSVVGTGTNPVAVIGAAKTGASSAFTMHPDSIRIFNSAGYYSFPSVPKTLDTTNNKIFTINPVTGRVNWSYWLGVGGVLGDIDDTLVLQNGIQAPSGNDTTIEWGGTLLHNTSIAGDFDVFFNGIAAFKVTANDSVSFITPKFAVRHLPYTVDTANKIVTYNVATGEFKYSPWLGGGTYDGTDFILNQNASGQTADAWIDGSLRSGTFTLDDIGASAFQRMAYFDSDNELQAANIQPFEILLNTVNSTQTGYFGSLFIKDNSTSYVQLVVNEDMSANRVLNYVPNDADRTLTMSGDLNVTANASVSGVNRGDNQLHISTADASNTGTGEDDLMTYSVPAGKLAANGDYIEFEMEIGFASNTNTKQIKVYFGATAALTIPAAATSTGGKVNIKGKVIRTGATSQKITVDFIGNSAHGNGASYSTASETLSGAITLKATGEATADADITQRILTVKYFQN